MKKTLILILTIFTLYGCGDKIEFNTPTFKAKKDGNLWEGISYNASVDNAGILTIVASDGFETITLASSPVDRFNCNVDSYTGLYSNNIGFCYVLGDEASFATLLDVNDVFWSTNNDPDSSVHIYPADGVINIREINMELGVVSGEFSFNAYNNSGLSSVNFNEGFFYNVPINNNAITAVTVSAACEIANAVVATTLIDYNSVMSGDANYQMFCDAYKTALTVQKLSCGDPNGAIQTTIDGLTCM